MVLCHDGDGRRVAGVDVEIRRATLAEVRSWDAGYGLVNARGERPFAGQGYRIPTLEEALRELPPVRVNVDLKSDEPELVDRFLEVVRRAGAEERVVGASFRRSTLRRLRAKGFRGETSLARVEFALMWLAPSFLGCTPPPKCRAQIPTRTGPFPLDTPRLLEKLRRLGLAVDFWTINDPDDARRLVRLGADGIMTDDPARIVPAVREAERSCAPNP